MRFAPGTTIVCRRCGSTARVLDGAYEELAEDVVGVLAAPDWSLRELERLQVLLQEGESRGETLDQAAKRIAPELPLFAKVLEALNNPAYETLNRLRMVSIAVHAVIYANAHGGNVPVMVRTAVEAIANATEKSARHERSETWFSEALDKCLTTSP